MPSTESTKAVDVIDEANEDFFRCVVISLRTIYMFTEELLLIL